MRSDLTMKVNERRHWQVADADAARQRIAEAGFDVSEVRGGNKPGTRVCTVRGEPCGVKTLLIEPGA